MGLFDKLRETVSKVVDDVVDSVQNMLELFPDDTTKKYYEIVYGLLSSRGGFNYDAITRYVDFHIGQPCDQEKLKKTLEYFQFFEEGATYQRILEEKIKSHFANKFPTQKIEKLIETNRALDETKNYSCTKQEAYDICYKDILGEIATTVTSVGEAFIEELKEIKNRYGSVIVKYRLLDLIWFTCYDKIVENVEFEIDGVWDVVNEHGVEFFSEGIERIRKKYKDLIDDKCLEEVIHEIIKKRYFEGHKTAHKVILTYLDYLLGQKKYKEASVASLTLRALHFENSNQNEVEYSEITEEAIRGFVVNNEYYISEVNKRPYEKQEHINEYVKEIKRTEIFSGKYNMHVLYFYLPESCSENYYSDCVCNEYWKEIAKKYENGESQDPNDVFNMILDRANS